MSGLAVAWLVLIAIRVIDGAKAGSDESMSGLLAVLEVASWLSLVAVIIAFSRRQSGRWFDATFSQVKLLTVALVVLMGAGLVALLSEGEGANIGLGLVFLIGLVILAVATVMVARAGSQQARAPRD